TLTFTAGVNAPGVNLSAKSTDPTIASVAPASAGALDRRVRNPEAVMTTNQRFTITGVAASGTCWVTVSSTDPRFSSMTLLVVVNGYGEQFAPSILILNQGESANMMPFSSSFNETVTSVTVSHPNVTITRPFANSPIFHLVATSDPATAPNTSQLTIHSNKGTYLEDYVFAQPISASPDNLQFTAAGQNLSFTVSEPAVATFMMQSLDTTVATVTAGASSSGPTSTQTFNVHSVGTGQTEIYVNDNLGYEANIDVMVGKPFSATPAALSFTSIGQEKIITMNFPPNAGEWWASAASSNESVVKVAFSASQWTAKAIAPGKATIYARDSNGTGNSIGEMISIPVDVAATGGVIH
ncbi:MAG TPA: hypothetical protein VK760_04200, partial [Candidatus Acidoferrales bacterium]|nr:hypothetical protein [Candidatus Acidoferrales bacterium]